MKKLTIPLTLLLALQIFLLSACSLPFANRQEKPAISHTYLLEWSPGDIVQPARTNNGSSVLIAPVRAAAGYTSSDLIYVKDTFELHRFVYHRWADTPARMLEPLLRLAIERTGRFSAVLPSGSQAQAELRLNSELLRLRQVFAGERSYIEFKLRVDLIDVQSGRFVAGRIFSYQEPCAASTPQAGVNAANKAVTLFMEELQQFLIGYLGAE